MAPARKLRPAIWLGPAVAVLAVVVAQATTLGGVTARSLLGVSQASSAPTATVIGCDNFTGTTGATLAGRAAQSAVPCANKVWIVHVGTWTIQSNQAASSATVNAVATEDVTVADSSVQVVLSNLNTASRLGGVVASHDGTATYLAAVMIDATPDRLELRMVTAGTPSVVATANPTFAATNTLALSRAGSAITVTLNAAAVLSYTLSASDVVALGTSARAGLFGGNASVRYDNFVVTSP